MKATLTSPDYRSATWICISIAIYNMMSGVNIINSYSTNIFDDIKNNGGGDGSFTTPQKNLFVGCSGFTGAFLSNFTVAFLSRRMILIGGHFLMGIFLLLVAISIDNKKPDLVIYFMSAFIVTF